MKENTPWVKSDKMFRVQIAYNSGYYNNMFGRSQIADYFVECFGNEAYIPESEETFYTNDLEGIKLFYKKYPNLIENIESKIAFDNRAMIWDHINTED